MANKTDQTLTNQKAPPLNHPKPPRPKLACFSFAAYSKTLIHHLKSLNVPILPGLSELEFNSIESAFRFSFPPDLRSVLQEGLPVSPGFPNWRCSSFQQLHLIINLPKLSLLRQMSQSDFWLDSWGVKPDDRIRVLELSKQFLEKAPVLVPVYRNCYLSSVPNTAGNPIYYVNGGEVRVFSFDLAGFFQKYSFLTIADFGLSRKFRINAPAWAATSAREVEFWTKAAERERRTEAREVTRGWWWSNKSEIGLGLGGCLEEVFWTLREGGWREEEVREMMIMDGEDEKRKSGPVIRREKHGVDPVVCHMRLLSLVLLRGGWSREDIVYSLDLQDGYTNIGLGNGESKSTLLDFEDQWKSNRNSCSKVDDHDRSSLKRLMHLQSLEV